MRTERSCKKGESVQIVTGPVVQIGTLLIGDPVHMLGIADEDLEAGVEVEFVPKTRLVRKKGETLNGRPVVVNPDMKPLNFEFGKPL